MSWWNELLAVKYLADWKDAVIHATTGALPAYSRVGNVITADANGAAPTIDGVAPTLGGSLLLWHGASGVDNGIYTWTTLGSGSGKWSLTRRADADSDDDVSEGMCCRVARGTLHGGSVARLTTTGAISLNTTSLAFAVEKVAGLTDGTADGQVPTWSAGAWVPSDTTAEYRLHILGDSNTAGANETDVGNVAGWRTALYLTLRQWRDDFDLIGTVNDGVAAVQEGLSTLGAWYHDGLGGETLGGAAAAYAGYIAAIGTTPHFIIDMLGTNDVIAGTSAANMMVARATLEAAYTANAPAAKVVAIGVPPFVAGTTVAGNLAAWNAVRTAYNTLLEAYCAARPTTHFYISPDALGDGSYQVGGVHLNQHGQGYLGRIVAEYLHTHLFGLPKGATLPRVLRARKPWGCVALPANTDAVGVAVHAGFNPGTASFAIAFDWRPQLLAGGFQCVCAYNAIAARPDFWAIYQTVRGLEVEFGSGGVDITNQPQEIALEVDRWYRVLLVAYANGADSRVGLYLDGKLVGLKIGLAVWNFGAHAFAFGTSPGLVGVPGYVGRIATWKGATVPKPGTMAALRAAEADYYLGETICTGGAASFPLNVSLASEMTGLNPLVAAGGAALIAAWPAAAPARPWEFPANDRRILTALGGGAAPVLGTIGGAGPAVAAQNSWLQMVDATGVAFFVPAWK